MDRPIVVLCIVFGRPQAGWTSVCYLCNVADIFFHPLHVEFGLTCRTGHQIRDVECQIWASLLCGRDVSGVYPCDNGLLCSSSKQSLRDEIQYEFYSVAFHLQFVLADLVLVSSATSSIPPAIKLETGF